ncbi:aminoglycoside phosphotransferase family protein [Phenylobacterium conjunctum]|uniref:Aminoglycoside phosphotransferase family protein n=1 Tax=Phenylobacterium conjunctum TaxID=1298959 RepID=A0ABW3T6L8_9CAUL
MPSRIHDDQVSLDEAQVRALLAAQFPQGAGLSLREIAAGTDHALWRLGEDLAVRLPLRASAAAQAQKEQQWLPRLAKGLPLPIPEAIFAGRPSDTYPWAWSVCRWIEGRTPAEGDDLVATARDLGGFVAALRAQESTGGPAAGGHNFGRGLPLATRDTATRQAIAACAGLIDTDAALEAWTRDSAAPVWTGPALWVHGDLCRGNLLLREGRLAAVIDFGGLGLGDPACDLLPAWNLFDAQARAAYRAALAPDEASWVRGRAWALSVALIQLPYYRETLPALAADAMRTIEAVLKDTPPSAPASA